MNLPLSPQMGKEMEKNKALIEVVAHWMNYCLIQLINHLTN